MLFEKLRKFFSLFIEMYTKNYYFCAYFRDLLDSNTNVGGL